MALAHDASLGTSNTAALSTSNPVATGGRVFLCAQWFDATATLSSVSGGSLTWVIDTQQHDTNSFVGQAIVTADAPAGLSASASITPTFSNSPSGYSLSAFSMTGVAGGASGYIDVVATARLQFTVSAWSSNNLVTTNANDVCVGIAIPNGGNPTNTPSGSATEEFDFAGNAYQQVVEWRIENTTGTKTIAGTWSTSTWDTYIVAAAYKAAAAATTRPWVPRRMPLGV